MNDNIVKLVFNTVAAGSGFATVTAQTNALQKKLGRLAQGVQVLGQCFGQMGGIASRGLAMLLQGGVWGAAASAIQLVVEKMGLFKKKTEEAATAAKSLAEHYEKTRDALAKTIKFIDTETAAKKRQIEITKAQTKAEYDLAIAKAKAAGNAEKAVELERKSAAALAKSDKAEKRLSVDEAAQKLAAANKAASGLPGWKNGEFTFDKKYWAKALRNANGAISRAELAIREAEKQNIEAVATAGDKGGGKKASDENMNDLRDMLERAKEAKRQTFEQMKASREAFESIAAAREALANAKQTAKTAEIENAAAVTTANAAAVTTANAKQTAKTAALRTPHADRTVGGSFDEHFNLWRDPEAAQQAQDEARRRTSDLHRFYRDVNRYGGKFRIDEAAELMRNGDEEGLAERLAQWRKSSKFTGQTEQMVLAAAARKNEGEADRNLSDIAKSSAEIAKSVETIRQAFEGGDE